MKMISNQREGNKVTLEIEEEYAAFSQAADRALAEAARETKLPGFRPGKAPKEMVERALNRDLIEARAAQNLISDLYPRIIEEAALEPVDFPNVEILQQEAGKPFQFKVLVDVYPEVKLGKYKGLEVEKKSAVVTEEDALKVLGSVQERFARTGPDGQKELLPLDDEFAKKVSRFGTLAELKAELLQNLTKDREAEAEADLKNNLVATASAHAKLEVPPGMVEREIDLMVDELRASLAQSGMSLEDYLKAIKKEEKELRGEVRRAAEVRVRGKIVLLEIAEAEKLAVEPAEQEKELQLLAGSTGESLAELKKRLGPESLKYISEYLLRQKALELLVEKAKIKEAK